MSEHTVPIPGCPGYEASCDGGVFSVKHNWRGYGKRRITAHPDRQGYLRVRLTVDGKRITRKAHQLIMSALGPPRPAGMIELRHLDGNPANNAIENLVWGTALDNAADRKRHGRTSRGRTHSLLIRAGLSNAIPEEDRAYIREKVAEGWSQRRIASVVGCSQTAVSYITRRES